MSNVREAERKPLDSKLEVEKAVDELENYTYLISTNKKVRESYYPPFPTNPNKLSEYTHKCVIVDTGFDMIKTVKEIIGIGEKCIMLLEVINMYCLIVIN